jgi:hypothetical protein
MLQAVSSLQDFWPKIRTNFFCSPCVLHAPPIQYSLIWLFTQQLIHPFSHSLTYLYYKNSISSQLSYWLIYDDQRFFERHRYHARWRLLYIPYLRKTKSSEIHEFARIAWVWARDGKFPHRAYPYDVSSRKAEHRRHISGSTFWFLYPAMQVTYYQDNITVIELIIC